MGDSSRCAIWVLALLGLVTVLATALLPLLGWRSLAVVGTSMAPTFSDGSLIVIRPADAGRIQTGDVITFRWKQNLHTHRVIAVTAGRESALFTTRGDHLGESDPGFVPASRVTGRVVVALPLLGYGYRYLGAGMHLLLLLPLCILVILRVRTPRLATA